MTMPEEPPHIDPADDYTREACRVRNRFAARVSGADLGPLLRDDDPSVYRGNVENLMGFAQLPIGLVGPLRLNGVHAQGAFLVPLATTEGTLVASYNRGARAISVSGGAVTRVTRNELHSALTFLTGSPAAARALAAWIAGHGEAIATAVRATTRHGTFLRAECTVFGSRLVVHLTYDPADAMGINMVTGASYAAAQMISRENGHVRFLFPSATQGDKKVTRHNFLHGRGRSVAAEVLVPGAVLRDVLKSSAEAIHEYHQSNLETALLAGGFGFNMHVANGITALGLATGQDVAYVAESANGYLVVERHREDLLFALSLPSLYVGTVGGGTALPTSRPCLELLGCTGPGSALKLAEIFAGTCLAGEISVLAAIASHQFVHAHETLGRNRPDARGR
jgi:hydroxymethylglutaryl-CoA reductase (NADPH)